MNNLKPILDPKTHFWIIKQRADLWRKMVNLLQKIANLWLMLSALVVVKKFENSFDYFRVYFFWLYYNSMNNLKPILDPKMRFWITSRGPYGPYLMKNCKFMTSLKPFIVTINHFLKLFFNFNVIYTAFKKLTYIKTLKTFAINGWYFGLKIVKIHPKIVKNGHFYTFSRHQKSIVVIEIKKKFIYRLSVFSYNFIATHTENMYKNWGRPVWCTYREMSFQNTPKNS